MKYLYKKGSSALDFVNAVCETFPIKFPSEFFSCFSKIEKISRNSASVWKCKSLIVLIVWHIKFYNISIGRPKSENSLNEAKDKEN